MSSDEQLDLIVDDESEENVFNPLALEDLIHLEEPLTEHTVVQILQTRFTNQKYFVSRHDSPCPLKVLL